MRILWFIWWIIRSFFRSIWWILRFIGALLSICSFPWVKRKPMAKAMPAQSRPKAVPAAGEIPAFEGEVVVVKDKVLLPAGYAWLKRVDGKGEVFLTFKVIPDFDPKVLEDGKKFRVKCRTKKRQGKPDRLDAYELSAV